MRTNEKMAYTGTVDVVVHPDIPGRGRLDSADASESRTLALLKLLTQYRPLLLRFVAIGLLASIALALLLPVRYESVARLMPPDQTAGMNATLLGALTSKAGDTLGAAAGDLLGMRTTGATLIGILTSRTVGDDLINRFDLRKVYSKRRYEDARKVLLKRTEVSEDRKSGIITIRVQDSSADRSALIARGYIDELNVRVSQLTTSSARRERMFLEDRLKTVKAHLDEASLRLSRFSSENKTFDPQVEGKTMLEAAATLQGQLIAAESELKGLEQIYGPENARVRAAAAKVGELRARLHRLSGSDSGEAKQDSTTGDLYPSIEQLPLLGNTYYDLARQARIDETVYEALTKQYELAKVEEAKEIPTIKVLDEPVVPDRRIWPPRLLIVILGTALAFCLGMCWIAGHDLWEGLDPSSPYKLTYRQLRKLVAFAADSDRQIHS